VAGSRGDGFTGERFQKVPCETVTGNVEDHPVPVRRPLDNALISRPSEVALRPSVSKIILWAVSAINCRPAGTAPNHSNQRRASSLSSTVDGRMAQVPPGLPFGMPQSTGPRTQHCPPRHSNTSQRHSPRPPDSVRSWEPCTCNSHGLLHTAPKARDGPPQVHGVKCVGKLVG
jgi:hypothetical protein